MRLSPGVPGVPVSIQTRYLHQRGSILQYAMRVAADLVKRYGEQFIRESLKTSDDREAIKKTEQLAKKYLARFDALQNDETLIPAQLTASATDVSQAHGALDALIGHVLGPKRQEHAGPDEERCIDDPEACLGPRDLQVVKMLQEGVEAARLSTTGPYWKTHKKSGGAHFVEGVE